jgi:hypothetical protein
MYKRSKSIFFYHEMDEDMGVVINIPDNHVTWPATSSSGVTGQEVSYVDLTSSRSDEPGSSVTGNHQEVNNLMSY